jgi:hypothetical protein
MEVTCCPRATPTVVEVTLTEGALSLRFTRTCVQRRTLCLKKEAVDEHGLEEAVIQTLTRGPESIYEGYQGMHCENSM